jgi:RNA polymerase primary sigma factor
MILRIRFGIGNDDSYTLEKLGKDFNPAREKIRQHEVTALKKLRRPAHDYYLKIFFAGG